MKKIALLISLYCCVSAVFAGSTTSSIYTLSGQRLSLGDHVQEMAERMVHSPSHIRSVNTVENTTAEQNMQYIYEIDHIIYRIQVQQDMVTKIEVDYQP